MKVLRCALAAFALTALVSLAAAQALPDRIPDNEFWRLVSTLSEAGGSFQHEWMSNEAAAQSVVPRLKEVARPGGAYVGVGHEQNFTYIAAIEPKIAFIVDIRRINMIDQLVYKAIFELSTDRADFLSRLLSRRRPPGLDASSTVDSLFKAYENVQSESTLFDSNFAAVINHLAVGHQFELTDQDKRDISSFLTLFLKAGPRVPNDNRADPPNPTYADLMTGKDNTGQQRSYLASEANFKIVQELQKKNLIVPVIGDLAGDTAIRKIGDYLRDHGTAVTVFYLSNVEQYLYNAPNKWERFYSNAASLPIDDTSMFIRSVSTGIEQRLELSVHQTGFFFRSAVASLRDTLKAYVEGRLTYRTAIEMSQ